MIFITGGDGFVGRNLVQRLVEKGEKTRCLVREGKSTFLTDLGAEVAKGDILEPSALAEGMAGCRAVIHLAGVWRAKPSTYRRTHVEGTANTVKAAENAGIKRFVYTSAMGVSLGIPTGFYKTKGESEESLKNSNLDFIIFRPAVIYGKGDEFTTAVIDLIKKTPIFAPVLGNGKTKFQPLFVGDLVECLVKAVDNNDVVGKTYDISGPDVLPYDEMLDHIMEVLGTSRTKIHMPLGFLGPLVSVAQCIIPNLPISTDELKIMTKDNIMDVSKAVRDFQLKQTSFKDGLKTYLPG